MLVNVAQKTVENAAFLVEEQVLERHLLLFVKKLLHNFEEVATKDGQKLLFFVKARCNLIEQGIIFPGKGLFDSFFLELNSGKFSCGRVVCFVRLVAFFSIVNVLRWILSVDLVIIIVVLVVLCLGSSVFDAFFETDLSKCWLCCFFFIFLLFCSLVFLGALLLCTFVFVTVQVEFVKCVNQLFNLVVFGIFRL